jgi:hypothetical protein
MCAVHCAVGISRYPAPLCDASDTFFPSPSQVLPVAHEFDPDLVIVSAGFDAAEGDPLGRGQGGGGCNGSGSRRGSGQSARQAVSYSEKGRCAVALRPSGTLRQLPAAAMLHTPGQGRASFVPQALLPAVDDACVLAGLLTCASPLPTCAGFSAVSPACFAHMTHLLKGVAPTLLLLEGGYNLDATAR